MTLDAIKTLVDLKPALDGYAGIPQETRLLFSGLRQLPQLEVKGLIQHGGRRLRPALTPAHARLSTARRILQLSKFIVSMNERPYSSVWERWVDNVSRYASLNNLSTRMWLGMKEPHSNFDARLFSDFIWRTFFDKTLSPEDKEKIAQDDFWVINTPRNHYHKVGLKALSWSSRPRYPLMDTRGMDFFVAQTPFPGRVSADTRMVVRYHDAVPVLMPHTINDKAFHQSTHFQALRSNVESGALFSCISEATRQDLLTIFPEAEPRAFVIHNMVSGAYHDEDAPRSLVPQLVRNRLAELPELQPAERPKAEGESDEFDYLLMVSTLEPRKNHLMLVSAWERLKYGAYPNLKLVVVGAAGWDHAPTLKAFQPWAKRGELYYLQNVPAAELRVLYRHASATVCPSLAEGFDYSGVEAMMCGCPVVSSGIQVHREIYRDASLYFDPYSVEDAARVIERVVAPEANELRSYLVEGGRAVAGQYQPGNILPQWAEFFARHRPRADKRGT
jgi:glycosyltransferase involved in cell wall biosynthesis